MSVAERRGRRRRRHARGDRGGAQPAARHPLARPARRRSAPGRASAAGAGCARCTLALGGRRVSGRGHGDPAGGAEAGDPRDGAARRARCCCCCRCRWRERSRSCGGWRATIVSAVPHVAVMELRAARARAVAIAATGAIAVFGSVAIQAAHGDLLHGLENAAQRHERVHRRVGLARQAPTTCCRQRRSPRRRAPGEARAPAGRARGARLPRRLARLGERRVWVIAPPRESSPLLPASQLVEGNLRQATARVRAGGWAVISRAIAEEHHLHIGDAFTLPDARSRRGSGWRRCRRTSAGRRERS